MIEPIRYQSKIDRKSIEYQSQIDETQSMIFKHVTQIDQNHRWSEKCRALRLGSRLGGVLEASWARLRGQHSPKLASQIEGTSIENRCKNPSKNDAFQVSILTHF